MQKLFSISLFNFLIAAVLGVIMRYAFVRDIAPLEYRHVMHAHSHLAMMGWIYMALSILIVKAFMRSESKDFRSVEKFLWFNQAAVMFMTISFLWQGYASVSIALSTLHLILSYLVILKTWNHIPVSTPSGMLVKTAMIWMVISSVALWLLPVIIMTLGKNSAWYFMAVQFFLHFQFNGWFLFAILGLKFRFWNELGMQTCSPYFKYFFYTLVLSCALTYTLAVTWSNPSDILFKTNSLGVFLQLAALYFLIKILWINRQRFYDLKNTLIKASLFIGIFSVVLKILIQSAVIIPYIAVISYTIRQFVIGFIHLTLLGAITGTVLGIAIHKSLLDIRSISVKSGLSLLLAGVIGTEVILFVQGLYLWMERGYFNYYYEGIFLISLILPLGIALILIVNVSSAFRIPDLIYSNTSRT